MCVAYFYYYRLKIYDKYRI